MLNSPTPKPRSETTWPGAVCFLGLLILLGWIAWLAIA